jgi:hypothetical protein
MQYEGIHSIEYKIIKKLKYKHNITFLKQILILYEDEIKKGNIVQEIRSKLLIEKYFM